MDYKERDGKVGAVVLGGDFQGYGAIQSLAAEGIPTFLVEHEWSIARYSCLVAGKEKNYTLLNENIFAEYLIDLAKRKNLKGWVLYANNDEAVKLLAMNRDKINGWYRNPVPPWEVVKKFYNKKRAYEIAESVSVPIPRMYRCSNADELLSQEIKFPVVLKPCVKEVFFSKTRKKAIRVNDCETLASEYEKMASIVGPSEVIIQEMIEGGPKHLFSYVTMFDGQKSICGMSARRKRQHPMDFGQATTFAESVTIPEIEVLAERILSEIGYYGLAEVEFMWDAREKCFKFIEINGRIWGWHTLTKAAGLNLPFVLFQHITGEQPRIRRAAEGVKWIRLITDIPTVFKEIVSGRMNAKEYLESLNGPKEFAVFSWRDPLPFFMEYAMIPYLWWKRGF